MSDTITPAEFDFLVRRAGLTLSETQKAEMIGVYPLVAAMAARIRTPPRDRMAEPAHIFVPGEGSAA
jgi:hypothetical protein